MVRGYSTGAGLGAPPVDTLAPHRITAVRVSGTCQAKSPFQPLCAANQLVSMGLDASGVSANGSAPSGCVAAEMRPPKAALVVLADDTHNSDLFYTQAARSTIGLSLADPAFQKTELGLSFFPGPGSCGTPNSFTTAVPPKLARLAKNDVIAQFQNLGANDGALLKPLGADVFLDGALRDAYALLSGDSYKDYYRRAVFVLGNRDFDLATCGQTPQARAAAAATQTNKIQTYVLMLARDLKVEDVSVLPLGSNELAVAGDTKQVYDARSNKGPAQDAFQTIVNDLATCVYDVLPPQTRPDAESTLSYSDPIDPYAKTTTVGFNGACSTEQVDGVGFGLDGANPNRAYLCKASCEAYRTVLRTASFYAAQNGQSPIAVPVFAHKKGCTVTANGGAGSGSGG